jgi:hypothetical protein
MNNAIKAIYISMADNSFELDRAITYASGCGLVMNAKRIPLGFWVISKALRILRKYRIHNEYIE